jgi:hypothetical protein
MASLQSCSSSSPQSPMTCRSMNVPGLSPLARTLSELPAAHDLAKRKPGDFHEASRNPASLAVARNGGIGSNCLNADVKALDRLQSVRGWNSSCCGEKYRS